MKKIFILLLLFISLKLLAQTENKLYVLPGEISPSQNKISYIYHTYDNCKYVFVMYSSTYKSFGFSINLTNEELTRQKLQLEIQVLSKKLNRYNHVK